MKSSTILLLIFVLMSVICPPQITISNSNDTAHLINLNVCNKGGQVLSGTSGIPALISTVTVSPLYSSPDLDFKEESSFYSFIFAKELSKPPSA